MVAPGLMLIACAELLLDDEPPDVALLADLPPQALKATSAKEVPSDNASGGAAVARHARRSVALRPAKPLAHPGLTVMRTAVDRH